MKFQNKNVLITGSTSGIGKALALELDNQGAFLFLHGRDMSKLRRIYTNKLNIKTVVSDLNSEKSWDTIVSTVKESGKKLDALILNAGEAHFSYIAETKEGDFDRIFNTNLKSSFFLLKELLPFIKDGGSIILNSSVAGKKGFPGMSLYSMTKAAQRSLVRSLSLELQPRKIRVNVVCPGIVDTELFDKMETPNFIINKVKEKFLEFTPMQRIAKPEEIIGIFMFLISEEASFITGAEFDVDGGIA